MNTNVNVVSDNTMGEGLGASIQRGVTTATHEVGSVVGDTPMEENIEETRSLVNQRMPQNPLGNFLNRYTQIATIGLASTDTALAAKGASFDPWSLFMANTSIANKVSDYAYIRGSIEVLAVTSAPPGGYGLYVVSAYPQGGAIEVGETAIIAGPAVETAAQTEHGFVNISNSTTVKLTLPFCYHQDFVAVGSTAGMWNVQLWCYQPISSATSDATLTAQVTYYARLLEDVELVVPVNQGKKSLMEKGKSASDSFVAATGMKASQAASKVAGLAETATAMFPVIAPFAGAVAVGATAVSSILDFFGFTRESAQRAPMAIVNRPFSNIANCDGEDTSEVAALFVGNSITIDSTTMGGTAEDCLSFANLFPRWTLVASAAWTASQTYGTTLLGMPVTPFFGRGTNTSFILPVAGFVGLPFSRWRGDMKYKIIIPVSKFHRGSLQIVWTPLTTIVSDPTNNTLNQIIDVGAGNEWDIEVGFAVNSPTLEVRIITNLFPTIIPVTGFNGYMSFRVVNPLTAAVAAAPTNIFVFAAAGENMTFGHPKTYDFTYEAGDSVAPTLVDFVGCYIQQGALGDEEVDETQIVLVPSSGTHPTSELMFGESVNSVRPLLQKFTQQWLTRTCFSAGVPPTSGIAVLLNHMPAALTVNQYFNTSPSGDFTQQFVFNWAGWYKTMFVGMACSTRYKLINQSSYTNSAGLEPELPVAVGVSSINTFAGYGTIVGSHNPISTIAPTWVIGNGEAVEVTVPYYGTRLFEKTYTECLIPTSSTTKRLDRIVVFPNKAAVTGVYYRLQLYSACGPDIRVNRFRYTPKLQFNAGFVTNSWIDV